MAFFIAVSVAIIYGITVWTQRSLEFWLTMVAGHEVIVTKWVSFFLALIGPFSLPFNLLTEYMRYFIQF